MSVYLPNTCQTCRQDFFWNENDNRANKYSHYLILRPCTLSLDLQKKEHVVNSWYWNHVAVNLNIQDRGKQDRHKHTVINQKYIQIAVQMQCCGVIKTGIQQNLIWLPYRSFSNVAHMKKSRSKNVLQHTKKETFLLLKFLEWIFILIATLI